MASILSQADVHKEFNDSIIEELVNQRLPIIIGPLAKLYRFEVPEEKVLSFLGQYNYTSSSNYYWPTRTTGSIIDLDYVQLWIEKALIKYYQDLSGGGDGTITAVSGYKNRIRTSATNGFVKNTDAYPRLSGLKDRDVKANDVVILRGGSPVKTLKTKILDIIPDLTTPTINAATSDNGNQLTQPNNQLTTAPSVNPTGGGASGGSLAAGTYYIQYAFTGPFGITWGSASHTGASTVQFTISAGNIPSVTLPTLPPGVSGINIYLTQPGGAPGTETLYASGVTTTTYNLSAAHTTGTSPVPKSATQTNGTVNNVKATANCNNYRGDVDGDIYEIYTITVTQGSTGGDATTAKLRVVSASGRDDVAEVTPAAFGTDTSIGSRGLRVRWTTSSGHNFIVGQEWQVVARQKFTAPTATSGGTYNGTEVDSEFDYIIKVYRGGYYSDTNKPQIIVSRSDGMDISGPTDVTNHSVMIPVGTKGVTVSFSNNGTDPGLCKNDKFYINVVSAKKAAYKTLVLQNNLPNELIAASDMDLTLCYEEDVQIPKYKPSDLSQVQWAADQNYINVSSNIEIKHKEFTDGGVLYALPIIDGNLYVTYREWLKDDLEVLKIYAPSSNKNQEIIKEISEKIGKVDPDNPIAFAVYKAAINSNRQSIGYINISDPTNINNWKNSLDLFTELSNTYSIVPLTRDNRVYELFADKLTGENENDSPDSWKTVWFCPEVPAFRKILSKDNSSDGNVILAQLIDDPGALGVQYTYLTVTTNNSKFIQNGVREGDILRYLYSIDPTGKEIYSQFIVKQVINDDSLIIYGGYSSSVLTPQKIEIWRQTSKQDVLDYLKNIAATFKHKRIKILWPDWVEDDNKQVSSVFLASALSGLTAGILPHQGLRNLEIRGFTGAERSSKFMNFSYLQKLGEGGVFTVTDDNGVLYTYRAVTTDTSNIDNHEEMVVRNDDNIRKFVYKKLSEFLGNSNNTNETRAFLQTELRNILNKLQDLNKVSRLGPAIIDAKIVEIKPHPTLLDRVIVEIQISRPRPLNAVTIALVF